MAAIDAATDAPGEDPGEELPWALRHRRYSTRGGSTGGLTLVEPGSGHPGAVRLQVMLDTAPGDDFLHDGEGDIGKGVQTLAASWTALPALEVFGALASSTTGSEEVSPTPTSHQVQGGHFGFKIFSDLAPLHLGAQLSAALRNDLGSQTPLLEATNISILGAASLDLRGLQSPVPLIARLNIDYIFDNSAKAVEAVEDARFEGLVAPRDRIDEDQQLISRVERYGLGINRVDMLNVGVGLETPLEVASDTYLHPVLEWTLGVPVNRQDFTCPLRTDVDDLGTSAVETDGCVGQTGFAAWPMNLVAGLRVVPPVRGVSLALAVNVGLGGTSDFVHEVAPNTPFALTLALGYDYDAQPAPAPKVVQLPPPLQPPVGRVVGRVVDSATGAPIAGASVAIEGAPGALASAADGSFVSYEREPGSVELAVSHPDFNPARCAASIPETGGEAEAQCVLTALPQDGELRGTITDTFGAAVAGARIQLSGPTSVGTNTDMDGSFHFAGLPPGDYSVRVDSASHFLRLSAAVVAGRREAQLQVSLIPRPATPAVVVKGGRIRATGLRFEGESTSLDNAAAMVVAELADVLLRQPALRRLRIVGNGDEQRSLARALEIRRRLVEAGVPEADIEAAGERSRRVKLSIMQ